MFIILVTALLASGPLHAANAVRECEANLTAGTLMASAGEHVLSSLSDFKYFLARPANYKPQTLNRESWVTKIDNHNDPHGELRERLKILEHDVIGIQGKREVLFQRVLCGDDIQVALARIRKHKSERLVAACEEADQLIGKQLGFSRNLARVLGKTSFAAANLLF